MITIRSTKRFHIETKSRGRRKGKKEEGFRSGFNLNCMTFFIVQHAPMAYSHPYYYVTVSGMNGEIYAEGRGLDWRLFYGRIAPGGYTYGSMGPWVHTRARMASKK